MEIKKAELVDCKCEQADCGKQLFIVSDIDSDPNEQTIRKYYQLVCLRCGARQSKHNSSEQAIKASYEKDCNYKTYKALYENNEQENIKLKKRQKYLSATIDDFQLQLAGANHTAEILQDIITKALER